MKPRVCIVDYRVGNRFSILSGLRRAGADALLTNDPRVLTDCDGIVLPGVGSFPAAMRVLQETGIYDVIIEHVRSGKPLLGICLGMQLLFDESLEWGRCRGLGLLPGVVRPMPVYKKPHIGWSRVFPTPGSKPRLLKGLPPGTMFYYAHSMYVDTNPTLVKAYSVYLGFKIPAIVEKHPVYATQFHPEKSSSSGLRVLQNWVSIVEGVSR